MFAVIKTGGKQYLVEEGQELRVEKLENKEGDSLEFDALLVSDEKAEDVTIGTPETGKKVKASIVDHGKGKKISVMKYKSKSRYRKNKGHRQPYTTIKIESIG